MMMPGGIAGSRRRWRPRLLAPAMVGAAQRRGQAPAYAERALFQSRSRVSMAVVRRCRKELRAAPREPIDRKPDPFAHGGVASSQPIAHAPERAQRIVGPARAPVDRVGFDRKARLAED